MKTFIFCFIIILGILSAVIFVKLLEKTIDEDEADYDEDIKNRVFRFSMNKRGDWKKSAFIWALMAFLNAYGAIFLLDPMRYGFQAILAFGVAIAQRNNASEIYVRLKDENISIYRNPLLGAKKLHLPSLLRVVKESRQIRFYQENVLVGKVSLKYLREEDEERLQSEIEKHVKIRTNN